MNLRKLDIRRLSSSKIPNNNYKRDIFPKNTFRINKHYFGGSNEDNKIIGNRQDLKEEEKSDINIFNKTYNNKHMFSRIAQIDNFNKLNNHKAIGEINKRNVEKKLPRSMSSNSLSKDSTLYKTKNRFLTSVKYDKFKKKNQTIALNPKRNSFNPRNGRSFSANNININSINSFTKADEVLNNQNLGNGEFITALDPMIEQNQVVFNQSNKRSNNRSYFIRKLNDEKKFLSYFDIQRILFLDRKIYKPDKEFEKKVYDLKNNNSKEFIKNFNFDKYKILILRLFQNQVSSQNFTKMKKNFEDISKGWRLRDNSRKRRRKLEKIPTTETERELKYNQHIKEREKRIQEKFGNKKKG